MPATVTPPTPATARADRMRVELVIAPPRPEGYYPRGPVSMEWFDRDWLCKYCDRERSASEPVWTWTPLGHGCTTCALRIGALAIDWSEHAPVKVTD